MIKENHFSPLQTTYLTKGFSRLDKALGCKDGRVVPKGFITDFASIPLLARSWVRSNDIPVSAVFHDHALTKLAELGITNQNARFIIWQSINRQMIKDMSYQGRHISKPRKFAILAGVTMNAWVKCYLFNGHPGKNITMGDLGL